VAFEFAEVWILEMFKKVCNPRVRSDVRERGLVILSISGGDTMIPYKLYVIMHLATVWSNECHYVGPLCIGLVCGCARFSLSDVMSHPAFGDPLGAKVLFTRSGIAFPDT
jgi:hypothetical protein